MIRTMSAAALVGALVVVPLPAALTRASTATPTATPATTPAATLSAEQVFKAMTLQQRVGQLFMVGTPATGVSSAARTAVESYHVGSIVLTGRSTGGVAATKAVTNSLQSLAKRSATYDVPLYIGADQEGGYVQVLQGSGFSRMPTALTQGTWATSTLTSAATTWGQQLKAAGVNLDLAPVMDTVSQAFAPYNAPIGYYQREYGYTSTTVATKGTAFANGMKAAGVSTSIKHFPGLGRVRYNTDTTSGVTDTTTTRTSTDINPFRAGVQAGVPFLMMSTAYYSRIDPAHPAAFSPTIIGGMVRGDLGFKGLVISDDLGNAKQVQAWSPGRRATQFINAGGDMILTVNPATIPSMVGAVVAGAEWSPTFRAKVDAAALRVLQIKQARGLVAHTATQLSVDGVLGPLTIEAMQRWLGVGVDGVFGPVTKAALQRRVGAYPDGVIGPRTVADLQHFLGIALDGASSLNSRTVAALQRYLNAHS